MCIARIYSQAMEWPLVDEWLDIAVKAGVEDKQVRSKLFELEALKLALQVKLPGQGDGATPASAPARGPWPARAAGFTGVTGGEVGLLPPLQFAPLAQVGIVGQRRRGRPAGVRSGDDRALPVGQQIARRRAAARGAWRRAGR